MSSFHHQPLISPLHVTFTDNEVPFYVQLMTHIVSLIEQGHLVAEQKMPSSRILAESLHVSRSTVVNAYDRLIAEDILYTLPKKGVFVTQKPLLKSLMATRNSSDGGIVSNKKRHQRRRSSMCRFDSGVDTDVFPKKAWLKSMRVSWQSPDPMVLSDDYVTGFPLLKEALAEYLYQLRGLSCHADQIMITAGNLDALTLINHLLNRLSPDSEWYVENPSYQPMQAFIQGRQKEVHYLNVDEDGCCLPEQSVTHSPVILMTPNRQYPLGMSLGSTRRQQWLNLLSQQRCWIVEDDYDNEFNYQRRDGLPLMQSDQSGRTFFVGSFSKILFRGLRLGYIVAPSDVYDELVHSRHLLGSSASLPMQPVVAEFMLNGEFARHMNKMRRHYRRKRDYLIQLFEENLTPWFIWQKPKGGMHAILMMKPLVRVDDEEGDEANIHHDQYLTEMLLKQNIQLFPLSGFYMEKLNQNHIREGFVCGFTGTTEEDMRRIVIAIQQTLQSCFKTLSKTGT